jgi:hypothetical protein
VPNYRWTDAELNFIRANVALMKDDVLAVALTRLCGRLVTVDALRHVRKRLGLLKRPGRGRCELQVIRPGAPGSAVSLHIAS